MLSQLTYILSRKGNKRENSFLEMIGEGLILPSYSAMHMMLFILHTHTPDDMVGIVDYLYSSSRSQILGYLLP